MSHSITLSDETTIGKLAVPPTYEYKPKEDITPYELALIVPIFSQNANVGYLPFGYISNAIEQLPEGAKRHFEKKD